ncbi:MAG: winged helix DNA-binding protein [Erysipelothrix sp.]|nr:winged helix DNA-binding protein [Erysipelothrix sp.]
MNHKRKLVNTIVIDIFNEVLAIQEFALQENGIKLSISEVHTLEAIEKAKEDNKMTDVAQLLNITASTLSINVNRLVKKGYIDKVQDERDRRVVHLVLTNAAVKVLEVHHQFHKELIDSFFTDLHIDEDDVLLQSLERVLEHLKNLKNRR